MRLLLATALLVISGSAHAQAVTIEYIAHACFRVVSAAGHSVMIDPFESRWWLGYDEIEAAGLPAQERVIVFEHAPDVRSPD